jgi:hypothetical protein
MSISRHFLSNAVLAGVVLAVGLSLCLVVAPSSAEGDPVFETVFSSPGLDRDVWCPCQINTEISPLQFPAVTNSNGSHFLRIIADEASLGGNECKYGKECARPRLGWQIGSETFSLTSDGATGSGAEAEEEERELPEPLGPSMIPLLRRTASGSIMKLSAPDFAESARPTGSTHLPCTPPANTKIYCTPGVQARADAIGEERVDGDENKPAYCIQRQEVRLMKDRKAHATRQPLWYTMRFRMPVSVEDQCNSVRWVTAQWKTNSSAFPANKYTDQNPFLAQRYDDGVLHVTVQDEACRCVIASAPLPDHQQSTQAEWTDGPVPESRCLSSKTGNECRANLHADYNEDRPALSSPSGKWTTMQYFVKPARNGKGEIIVRQDGVEIVKVTGDIGYEIADEDKNVLKFKFGHYRDYMPFHHEMDVYSVSTSPMLQ